MDATPTSSSAAAAIEQGLDLLQRGDLWGARAILKAGCQHHPRDYLLHYNLACVLALLGKDLDDACIHLQRAVHFGYRKVDALQKDPDLNNIRGHPGYQKAVAMCRAAAANASKVYSGRPPATSPLTPPPTPNQSADCTNEDESSPPCHPLPAPRAVHPPGRPTTTALAGRAASGGKEGDGSAANEDAAALQLQLEELREQREELARAQKAWAKEQQAQRKAAEEERARAAGELQKQREELAAERRRLAAEMDRQRQEMAQERAQCHAEVLAQRKKVAGRHGPGDRPCSGPAAPRTGPSKGTRPVLLSPYYLLIDEQGPKFEPLLPAMAPDATLLLDSSEDAAMSVTTQQVMRNQIWDAQNDDQKPREWSAFHSEYKREALAQHILDYLAQEFVDNDAKFAHANAHEWGSLLLDLCDQLKQTLSDPILLALDSPVYVMGDIHGNFEDLLYFMRNLIQFGHLQYTSCKFLFLGDYVDRGEWSLEVVAYVFALKLLVPNSVYLLRGNHELHEVNGDVEGYGEGSFKAKCMSLLGDELGEDVWVAVNFVFQNLPLAAVLDDRVFCVHGGIPRYTGGPDKRMDLLRNPDFPRFNSVMSQPTDAEDRALYRQMAMDLLWSDPATTEEEGTLDGWGFGPNFSRESADILVYGEKAINQFLATHKLDVIIRAHEAKQAGVRLCKGGRVLTVFTTSAYCGGSNGAGAAYVAQGAVRMVSVSLGSTKSRRVSDKFITTAGKKGGRQGEDPRAVPYAVTSTHPHPRKMEHPSGHGDGRRRLENGHYEPPKPRPPGSGPAAPVHPGLGGPRGGPPLAWPPPPPISKVHLPASWALAPTQVVDPTRSPAGF